MPKHDMKKNINALHDTYNEKILKITKNLDDIWDRIGFNDTTKLDRLEKFYEETLDLCSRMLESEEDLEDEIASNIKEFRQDIRTICIELGNKYDEKYATGNSMIDEEKMLRDKLKQLQVEKRKRQEEYENLSTKEGNLCEKLGAKKTNIKSSVPTENEIENLKNRIKELEKIKKERLNQMIELKEEIIKLFHDLDMSQSDSFSELIIVESIDELPLSENDINKAKDLRNQLKIKDEKLTEQIKSLKYKIKQLWSKLSITNEDLVDIVESSDEFRNMNKGEILVTLNDEYERCLKIKMANLEKFIEQIRLEISVYYEKLYFSDSDIKKFAEFFNCKDFTEDLLKIHEEKLEDLKFKYDECQFLYEKTAKWLDFWQQFILFEEKTKDPNRFKVRGYNALEEEKARKQFNLQFPKLEEELRRHAEEYKETNGGEVFTIYGNEWSVYLDMLRKDYDKHKQNEKKEKQQATAAGTSKNLQLINKHVSKLITPSFQKSSIKRKNNECIGSTFGQQTPSLMRNSKLQRTESNVGESTVQSTVIATPKNKLLLNSKNAKRKSRTPLKHRLRQSRMMVNNKQNLINASNVKSTLANSKGVKTSSSPKASKYKVPSKLKASEDSNDTTLTATSNGTVITVSSKASTTTTSTNASSYRTGGYPFRHINTNDINYHEFTRDLHKPFRFNNTNNATTASNHNYIENDIKNKLTSTLIKE